MVIEVMGHNAGWIALHAGIAGGGDIILLPELEYDLDMIAKTIKRRDEEDKSYTIVVVGEGIKTPGKKNAARYIAKQIQERTGHETRETILGYIQRGGSPSPADRILATRYGAHAAKLINQGKFGTMVSLQNDVITSIPLEEVGGKTRLIKADHALIKKAKHMGVCFGNKALC